VVGETPRSYFDTATIRLHIPKHSSDRLANARCTSGRPLQERLYAACDDGHRQRKDNDELALGRKRDWPLRLNPCPGAGFFCSAVEDLALSGCVRYQSVLDSSPR
jgi:hypothetical protein